jgi:hypothetical protein
MWVLTIGHSHLEPVWPLDLPGIIHIHHDSIIAIDVFDCVTAQHQAHCLTLVVSSQIANTVYCGSLLYTKGLYFIWL